MTSSVARSVCWFVAVTLTLGFVVSLSAAPRAKRPRQTQQPGPVADDVVITELELAKSVLEKAKHDYDGHRATAIDHLQSAIDAMKQQKTGKDDKKKDAKDATKEDKSTSDSSMADKPAQNKPKGAHKVADDLLRDAYARLGVIHRQMTMAKAPAHQKKAAGDVTSSMTEIDTGLKIK
jgi:hypothetical protein